MEISSIGEYSGFTILHISGVTLSLLLYRCSIVGLLLVCCPCPCPVVVLLLGFELSCVNVWSQLFE